MTSRARRRQFVFVHGACHDGWCWAPVLERLHGADGIAVDLPLSSFDDDVAAVRAAIAGVSLAGPVVLVGHSYSGLVITAAGHQASALVYIAARMPDDGEVPSESTPTWSTEAFQHAWVDCGDGSVTLDAAAIALLYPGAPHNLARLASQHWRPQRSAVPKVPVVRPAWHAVPATYVVCAQDKVVRPESQRACAAKASAAVELECDHSPFFSRPADLADLLLAVEV